MCTCVCVHMCECVYIIKVRLYMLMILCGETWRKIGTCPHLRFCKKKKSNNKINEDLQNGSGIYCLWAKSSLLSMFANKVLLEHGHTLLLAIVSGCFPATVAELRQLQQRRLATETLWYTRLKLSTICLSQKSLPAPDLHFLSILKSFFFFLLVFISNTK